MAQRGKASRSIASDGGAEADSAEPIAAERAHEDLAHDIKNGAKWSMFGNIITRAGSLLVGILVANIVGSVGVGVFAIALTVGQMLLTLIDMGLGTDLIRGTNEEMERKAPTIASLGMIFCTIGALFLVVFAAPIAHVMGSDAATPLMRVYAIMVFIGGLAIVPQGILMRTMDQRSLFFATVSNFIVGNGLTLGLLLGTDIGVLALPIGAAVGMAIEVTMFYVSTKRRLHFGWDRTIMRSTLSFGVPVAGSNVLQVLLGNVDRMLIGATLGERRLGHYAMASNVAQWPVSVFGLVVRTVAMPAFARTKPTANDPVLTLGAQLTWLISLPVGVMLALLSHDVIYFLYGEEFGPAVPLLTTLAIYGAIRVMFDTFTGFLYARSNSRGVLTANIIWVVALIGMTWIGARRFGLEGAAWAQVVSIVCVALPAFLYAIHKTGGSLRNIARSLVPGTVACIPAGAACFALSQLVDRQHLTGNNRIDALIGVAVGGVVFLAVYVPMVYKKIRASVAEMRADGAEPEVAVA